jgi:hypothetical protein
MTKISWDRNKIIEKINKERSVRIFINNRCREGEFSEGKSAEINSSIDQVTLFAGEDFSRLFFEISEEKKDLNIFIVDCSELKTEEEIKEKIVEIYSENISLINGKKFPLIVFKDIDVNKNLENFFIKAFDPNQRFEFGKEGIKLQEFIIFATSSNFFIGDFSQPLISRLDIANVGEAKNKIFFLEENFNILVFFSILVFFIFLLLARKINAKLYEKRIEE